MNNIDELSKRLKKTMDKLNETLTDIQSSGEFKVFFSDFDTNLRLQEATIVRVFSTTHGKIKDVWVIGHLTTPT